MAVLLESDDKNDNTADETLYAPVYLRMPLTTWLMPNFELRVEDLSHPGTRIFFANVNPEEALREAVVSVCSWLYTLQDVPLK